MNEIAQLAKEWGSAGACVATVLLFLKYLRETQLATNSALAKMADAIDRLSRRVEHCPNNDEKKG